MLIIPAIDIAHGRCVRLRQGDFATQTVYSRSPVDVAKSFLQEGFPYLHVVDLDGAKSGRIVNWESLEAILALPGVKAEVGGGVRTDGDLRRLLQLGADRVVVGSIAITRPSLVKQWIHDVGSQRIAIAVDIRNGRIAHSGWQELSDDTPKTFLLDLVKARARTFICTDIDRDGMLQGPNIELYKEIRETFNAIELIASGGVSSLQDIETLARTGVAGVIVGKAIYEGTISLKALQRWMIAH
jgi:phosphoribosylformimino-5-aminoimidazole carboxamide ribotide isomerase